MSFELGEIYMEMLECKLGRIQEKIEAEPGKGPADRGAMPFLITAIPRQSNRWLAGLVLIVLVLFCAAYQPKKAEVEKCNEFCSKVRLFP